MAVGVVVVVVVVDDIVVENNVVPGAVEVRFSQDPATEPSLLPHSQLFFLFFFFLLPSSEITR